MGSAPKAAGRKRIGALGLSAGLTPRSVRRPWLAGLLLLALFALFPFGWLGEVWPAFGRWLGSVFPTAGAHAIGHITIFLLVGLVALFAFPGLRERGWLYGGLLLAAAVMQEFFQLVYKHRPLMFDDFRDVFTDLVGGLLAYALAQYLFRKSLPARERDDPG